VRIAWFTVTRRADVIGTLCHQRRLGTERWNLRLFYGLKSPQAIAAVPVVTSVSPASCLLPSAGAVYIGIGLEGMGSNQSTVTGNRPNGGLSPGIASPTRRILRLSAVGAWCGVELRIDRKGAGMGLTKARLKMRT
jgi:hypothetical protein